MSLRPDRFEDVTDISYFMNVTATRGLIVVHDSSGSGAALDDSSAYVAVPTGQAPSTTEPAGLLLNDVVNIDQTRQHLNWHQDEMQLGGKVTLLRRGWVVTDSIVNGQTPSGGDPAFYN